ncbi:MAG: glutamate--tRNA ligase family protein, partial [bacterium]|nr:glutamate--tRNA ligase family protein [bacterium]
NMLMRDPVIFRWIDNYGPYPMYDFAHPLSDFFEGINHSLCTLEFEVHREFYEWVLDNLVTIGTRPRQIEFSRLNMSHTITSKRKINSMIEAGIVSGWDDPRLPTISGLRARGYTPSSIREFCDRIGVTKFNGISDYAVLESILREELNKSSSRLMVVLDPLEVEIANITEPIKVTVDNNPEDESAGSRELYVTSKIWIERDDFRVEANRKYHRLKTGGIVRLKGGVVIECVGHEEDSDGNIAKVNCVMIEAPEKVKGTIHWVGSESESIEVKDYRDLFLAKEPGKETGDFLDDLNKDSLVVYNAKAERSAVDAEVGSRVQFLRKGYYIKTLDGYNKTVGLRSSFKD